MSATLCKVPSVLAVDKTDGSTDSPLQLFERTAAQISQVFVKFKSQYGMEAADFYGDLQEREPHIARRLELLEAGIDSDIAGRCQNGQAHDGELQTWRERVFAWKELLLSALRLYEISHFGEEILVKNPAN
ncbi:hypothetical protein JW992_06710 [candidate division KSB1 bacterium]|nr:hypothetical protein [candidate division KSB1 bacterium]